MPINTSLSRITAQNDDTEAGAPVAILEAQATGLPTISPYADIPEVVVDGKSALLAPERDVEAVAKPIIATNVSLIFLLFWMDAAGV